MRRQNLRTVGLPECFDYNRNIDVIFQGTLKENCSDLLEQESKIELEKNALVIS